MPPQPVPVIVEKAVCYITRDRRILVFEHPGAPDAGIQVPAGTIEPGEDPARAALREAAEESGLRGETPDSVPRFNLPYAFVLSGPRPARVSVAEAQARGRGLRPASIRSG